MSEQQAVFISQEVQALLLKIAGGAKDGSISIALAVKWLAQWLAVLAIGFAIGLAIYGVVSFGGQWAVHIALQKAGLFKATTEIKMKKPRRKKGEPPQTSDSKQEAGPMQQAHAKTS